MVPLSDVFKIQYGNQLNANALEMNDQGVNFVTRSSRRLGISRRVSLIPEVTPFQPGCITATMGGSYLLSAFVQPREFYTAQNIKVLQPLAVMSFNEKAFYCQCIAANRWLYSSHGREANRSFDDMLVPDRQLLPAWVNETAAPTFDPTNFESIWDGGGFENIDAREKLVPLKSLFDFFPGSVVSKAIRSPERIDDHFVPLIRPSSTQAASYIEWVDSQHLPADKIYPADTLYISTNGQGSHTYAYVAVRPFTPNIDVTVALPKRSMSVAEKLYYASAITKNRPLFSYGRKPKAGRLDELLVPSEAPSFAREKAIGKALLNW